MHYFVEKLSAWKRKRPFEQSRDINFSIFQIEFIAIW